MKPQDVNIVINMCISPKLSNVIIWDLKQDIEEDSYDVSSKAQAMFDSNGEIYIMQEDHIIVNQSGGRCFSYQLEDSRYLKEEEGKIKGVDM